MFKILKLPSAPDAMESQRCIKRYFFVQKYSFAAVGIDPTSLESTIYYPLRTWIPFVSIVTLCLPVFLFASKYTDDLDQMANILAPIWQSVLAIIKFSLFMWNRKKIVGMVRDLWLWNLKANDEELKIIADENFYDTRISVFYYSSVFVSAVLATILPILIATFFAWKGYSFWEALEPPFRGVYFFDIHKSYFAYLFVFVWNAFGIYFVLNGTLAIDTLFSWIMRNISAQFRILNLHIEKAAHNANRRRMSGTEFDMEFHQSLTECIKYHRRVIDMAYTFNEVYKHIVFIKFLMSCIQIACVTFQFPHSTEIAIQLFNVSFMISVSTQLMLYCHGGQRIQDLSTSVDSTIYENFQWHNLNVKNKKLLMLPMMRSQKPCNLTGIFFVADLGLFVWVFKTAGSFLTMMMSIYQSDPQSA